MSVRRAQLEISVSEFLDWLAFSLLEPDCPERDDQRIGVVYELIAQVNGNKHIRARDFLRHFDYGKQFRTQEEITKINKFAVKAAFGGKGTWQNQQEH